MFTRIQDELEVHLVMAIQRDTRDLVQFREIWLWSIFPSLFIMEQQLTLPIFTFPENNFKWQNESYETWLYDQFEAIFGKNKSVKLILALQMKSLHRTIFRIHWESNWIICGSLFSPEQLRPQTYPGLKFNPCIIKIILIPYPINTQKMQNENQTYSPKEATWIRPNLTRDHFKDQFFMGTESG